MNWTQWLCYGPIDVKDALNIRGPITALHIIHGALVSVEGTCEMYEIVG